MVRSAVGLELAQLLFVLADAAGHPVPLGAAPRHLVQRTLTAVLTWSRFWISSALVGLAGGAGTDCASDSAPASPGTSSRRAPNVTAASAIVLTERRRSAALND